MHPARISLIVATVLTLAPVTYAAPRPSDATPRVLVGRIGDGRTLFSLTLTGKKVTGSSYRLPSTPTKLTVDTLDGSLTGNRLALSDSAPDDETPSATIAGTVAGPLRAGGSATFTGTRTFTKSQSQSGTVTMKTVAFGPSPGATVRDVTLKRNSRRPRYEIEVVYPQIVGGNVAAYAWLNQRLKAIAVEQVASFEKLEREIDSDQPSPSDEHDGLWGSYEIMEFTPDFVSIRYLESTDTGGAHPNSYTVTANLVYAEKRQLKLADLFADRAGYLRPIALATIKALSADPDSDYDMITAGAGTRAANYQNWNLTRWGCVFTFDPYQVGPYAAGVQQVAFPLDALPAMSAEVRNFLPEASLEH